MNYGRRTASLKASYEAIHGSSTSGTHELLIGRELAGAVHSQAIQAAEREGNTLNSRRQKKLVNCALRTSTQSNLFVVPFLRCELAETLQKRKIVDCG